MKVANGQHQTVTTTKRLLLLLLMNKKQLVVMLQTPVFAFATVMGGVQTQQILLILASLLT